MTRIDAQTYKLPCGKFKAVRTADGKAKQIGGPCGFTEYGYFLNIVTHGS